MTNVRIPHEYADLLDRVLSRRSSSETIYLVSNSSTLAYAVGIRHDQTITQGDYDEWVSELVPEIQTVDSVPSDIDHALILEPDGNESLVNALQTIPSGVPCDCIVANPYSFNRIQDRSLSAWCSPVEAHRALRDRGFEVTVEGMHGLRSLTQSVAGKAWQSLGRLDRRDVHTHRMRAAYRERWLPLAMTSCFVQLTGVPREHI